jgi:branched-subunit amino acid transport protein
VRSNLVNNVRTTKAVVGRDLVASGFVTRVTRRIPLVDQKPLTLPEQLRSSPDLCGIPVAHYLIVCVVFVDSHLSFLSYFFWTL